MPGRAHQLSSYDPVCRAAPGSGAKAESKKGWTQMNFTLKKQVTTSYEETLQRLPDALKSEGFGVLTEIDVKDVLKQKLGVDFRRYKILGACNPSLAHEALSTTLEVGAMLPCNVIVYEGDDGKAVVHAIDPMQTVATADPRLGRLATIVREKLTRALERLS
jgi:uncharacterized protein (DUF302 family)